MSKIRRALLFIMLLCVGFLHGNNIFKSADSFHHALDSANSNQKLLLSYAGLSSVPCCIAMEKATFHNKKVQDILKTAFYPVKVDLSTSVGKSWADNFQITNTPTLLFFDNDGTLIKQVENCISSTELIVILEEVLFFKEHGFWPMEKNFPVVLTAYVPKISTPQAAPSHSSADQEVISSVHSSENLIRILLDEVPTSDTSIKVAVEQAKLKFPQHPISVKLVKKSQGSHYRIWIGQFRECLEAQILLESLKKQGFVKAQLTCHTK